MNGYYTWARMGYDGHLPHEVRAQYPELVHVAPRGSIHELMRAPVVHLHDGRTMSGADFWRQHGATWEGAFDLRAGSASRQVLRSYLEEKGKKAMADNLQLREPQGRQPNDDDGPWGEEIEWTDDDEAAASRAWARLHERWTAEEQAQQGQTPPSL